MDRRIFEPHVSLDDEASIREWSGDEEQEWDILADVDLIHTAMLEQQLEQAWARPSELESVAAVAWARGRKMMRQVARALRQVAVAHDVR